MHVGISYAMPETMLPLSNVANQQNTSIQYNSYTVSEYTPARMHDCVSVYKGN